jgi:hypothetical protein
MAGGRYVQFRQLQDAFDLRHAAQQRRQALALVELIAPEAPDLVDKLGVLLLHDLAQLGDGSRR